MERCLKLKCTDTTLNMFTKTIPFVNPNASNFTLKSFAIALNGLTTNTLNKVEKVDTTDISNATNE